MIDDFSTIKSQLKELAPIINEFKSEQVQLRLVDMLIKNEIVQKNVIDKVINNEIKKHPKASRIVKKKRKGNEQPPVHKTEKKSSSKKGPSYYLSLLIQEGYFNKAHQINSIVEHLKTDKAKIYKVNELSTPLARLIRSGILKRNKNAEGQFEYEKAK